MRACFPPNESAVESPVALSSLALFPQKCFQFSSSGGGLMDSPPTHSLSKMRGLSSYSHGRRTFGDALLGNTGTHVSSQACFALTA